MGRFRREQMLTFWAGVGILFATVGVNRLFASGLVNYQVLYGYLERGWTERADRSTFTVFKIVAVRILQTASVIWLCRSRFRQFFSCALPVLFGAGTGAALVFLTWCRGAAGIFLFLALWFPHGLLYLVVWTALLFRCTAEYEFWQQQFRSAVLALLAAGILLEILVNPCFLGLLQAAVNGVSRSIV